MLHLLTHKESEGEDKQRGELKGLEGLKRQGEVSLSGSMTRQVHSSLLIACGLIDLGSFSDRAGLPITRHDVSYFEYWENDRRYGN